MKSWLLFTLAISLFCLATSAPAADGWKKLSDAIKNGDEVKAADVRFAAAVGKCLTTTVRREPTGTYSYSDSGLRHYRGQKTMNYSTVVRIEKSAAMISLIEKDGKLQAFPSTNKDEDSYFSKENVDGAIRTAEGLAGNSPRGQVHSSTFHSDGGLTMWQRYHYTWLSLVDNARYSEIAYEVKSSTLGTKNRYLVMRQYCRSGFCSIDANAYSDSGDLKARETMRLCALVDSSLSNAKALIDEVVEK